MALQDALTGARELVPRVVFEDVVRIERKTGTVFDPETGLEVEEWAPIYEGPCKAKPNAAGRDAEWGEREVVLHRYQLKLPYSVDTPVMVNDRATVTASPDAWLVGRALQVVDVQYSTTAVTRRLLVEDREG